MKSIIRKCVLCTNRPLIGLYCATAEKEIRIRMSIITACQFMYRWLCAACVFDSKEVLCIAQT